MKQIITNFITALFAIIIFFIALIVVLIALPLCIIAIPFIFLFGDDNNDYN